MPTMFPTPPSGGDDPNRRARPSADSAEVPKALKVAFWLLLGTSALMILSGLVLFTSGYTGPEDADAAFKELVVENQKFIGGINAFSGIVIAALTSQIPRGGKNVRRILLAIILLSVLVDLISFVTRSGGFALALIAILLALGALLLFRPNVSDHIERNHMARVAQRRQ